MYYKSFVKHSIQSMMFSIITLMLFSCSKSKLEKSKGSTAAKAAKEMPVVKKTMNNSIAYLVSDIQLPFWGIMVKGVENAAVAKGYDLKVYSAGNVARDEIAFTVEAIKNGVKGIVVSPTNSSACVTILKLAKGAGIPVVISDVGTDGGEYVTYISSDNKGGAYKIGKVLSGKMIELGWNKGKVGIVAIPQKRLNGQARTAGFMQAMNEAGIKSVGMEQQVTFSEEETYNFAKNMIAENPDLRAIWLQGSDKYRGALKAIGEAGKTNEILLLTFDAEPEFIELIQNGTLLGSAMQQPYLMGQEAMLKLDDHLNGKEVLQIIGLPILAISQSNIKENLPVINERVLGNVSK